MGAQHILRAGEHHGASGPVGPASVSPAAWYKADAGTSTTSDGTGVSQWDDQSGNGRHVTQGTSGARPLYKASILSSLPVLRFQGTDDFMSYLPGADWVTGTGLTVFTARVRRAAVGNTCAMALVGNGVTDDYNATSSALIGFEGGSSNILQDYRAGSSKSTSGAHPGDGVAFTDTSLWDGTNDRRYLNTTAESTFASTGSFAVRNLYLGCRYTVSAPAFFGQCDFGEVLIYDQALGGADIAAVQSYLKAKWGTP